MKIRKRLLVGVLGVSLGIGLVYAIKPGNCPSIREYGPYYRRYDVALVYGGNSERAREAARLYRNGYFERVILLGNIEIDDMIQVLTKNGVPVERITRPVRFSYDTLENITTGNETVRQHELGNVVAHVSGKVHLDRIKMLNEMLSKERNTADDGYFPIDEEFGTPILKLPRLRDSDLASWYACVRDREQSTKLTYLNLKIPLQHVIEVTSGILHTIE